MKKVLKKGGKVKAKAKKTNKPKVRGHGCEKRGKTKGRIVKWLISLPQAKMQ
jgi:hypothetical protein